MNIADLLFWPSFLMFAFALIFVGAAWFYDNSIARLRSDRCRKCARWFVFVTGAICGASAFLAGFIELSAVNIKGGLGMLFGFLVIQLALLLAPSRKLLDKKMAVKDAEK